MPVVDSNITERRDPYFREIYAELLGSLRSNGILRGAAAPRPPGPPRRPIVAWPCRGLSTLHRHLSWHIKTRPCPLRSTIVRLPCGACTKTRPCPLRSTTEETPCDAGTLFWEWALDTLQERDGLTVLANDTTFTQIIGPALREAQTYASPSVPGCQQVAPRPTAPPVQARAAPRCRLCAVPKGRVALVLQGQQCCLCYFGPLSCPRRCLGCHRGLLLHFDLPVRRFASRLMRGLCHSSCGRRRQSSSCRCRWRSRPERWRRRRPPRGSSRPRPLLRRRPRRPQRRQRPLPRPRPPLRRRLRRPWRRPPPPRRPRPPCSPACRPPPRRLRCLPHPGPQALRSLPRCPRQPRRPPPRCPP
jgi:hypothetical protein